MHLAKSRTIVDDCVRHALAKPDEIVFRFLDDGESESARLTYRQLLHRAATQRRRCAVASMKTAGGPTRNDQTNVTANSDKSSSSGPGLTTSLIA